MKKKKTTTTCQRISIALHSSCQWRPTIHIADQWELRVKALGCEQLIEEGSEQPLVKLIVNLATIDALGHEGGQGIPWYFLWG